MTKCIKDGDKTFPYVAKWKNKTICGLFRTSVTVQMSYMTKDLKVKKKKKNVKLVKTLLYLGLSEN